MTRQRLTVAEAAEVLGISQDATRMRIKRGTLDAVRDGTRLYVLLDIDPTTDPTADQTRSEPSAIISAKDETIAVLREQLESERRAHAEARRIIAALVERVPPAIESPPDTSVRPPEASPPPYEESVWYSGGGERATTPLVEEALVRLETNVPNGTCAPSVAVLGLAREVAGSDNGNPLRPTRGLRALHVGHVVVGTRAA